MRRVARLHGVALREVYAAVRRSYIDEPRPIGSGELLPHSLTVAARKTSYGTGSHVPKGTDALQDAMRRAVRNQPITNAMRPNRFGGILGTTRMYRQVQNGLMIGRPDLIAANRAHIGRRGILIGRTPIGVQQEEDAKSPRRSSRAVVSRDVDAEETLQTRGFLKLGKIP